MCGDCWVTRGSEESVQRQGFIAKLAVAALIVAAICLTFIALTF
jgi:hypothetical protein